MHSFENKVVLVTGGSRGIGREIALKFYRLGAKVAITYKSRVDQHFFNPKGIKYYQCDSGNAARTAEVVKSVVKEFGTLDVLVNNAGVTKDGLIMRMKEEDWDSVINTNLKGAFLFCREAAKVMMKKHYGKIINISSITAVYGNAGQSNYVASKAGMIGLTLAMAKEFAAYDIQVNVVAPGFVETDMTSRLTPQQKETLFNQYVKRKAAKPDKVADFVTFLASPDSDLINGQTFVVEASKLKKEEMIHFKPE
jgi:3-oxoacyl-[acyl-carrier protein] reductase